MSFLAFLNHWWNLPFLVMLRERGDGYVPGHFLTAADLGETGEGAAHKPVLLDAATGEPVAPNGSLGFRFGPANEGRWNLDLGAVDPALTLHDRSDDAVAVDLPRFDIGPTEGGESVRRGRGVGDPGLGLDALVHPVGADDVYVLQPADQAAEHSHGQ